MNRLPVWTAFLFAVAICHAQHFSLRDANGGINGPFALREGTPIAVGSNTATVTRVVAPDDVLLVRIYRALPSIGRDLRDTDGKQIHDPENLKSYFALLDVTWPAGSSIRYLSGSGEIIVCNTRPNLQLIEERLVDFGNTTHQVQVDLQFVAFDLTNIVHLASTGISAASITALWTNGCGEILAAPTVVTRIGQEAVVKGVTEFIYPTEFITHDASTQDASNAAAVAGTTVVPARFQTREVGAILQVVPETASGGRIIILTLSPQIVEDPVWEDYGPMRPVVSGKERQPPMRQPIFHVLSTSTSISVANGRRVMIGGGMPTRDHKRLVYVFATATVVDLFGVPVKLPSDSDNEILLRK